MKYLLVENNIKTDSSFSNVFNYGTEEVRDNYINSNLFSFSDTYKNHIDGFVDNYNIDQSGTGSVVIKFNGKYSDIVNKNYVILKDCDREQIKFYFITNIRKHDGSNEYLLEVKEDYFASYPDIASNLRSIEISEGHVPLRSYLDFNFDGGDSNIVDYNKVLPKEVNTDDKGDKVKSTLYFAVFRKLHSGEEGMRVERLIDGKTVDITLPFKMFIAPVEERGKVGGSAEIIRPYILLKYYQEKADGLTYAIKVFNYEFDNGASGNVFAEYNPNIGDSGANNLLEVKKLDLTNTIPSEENNYAFDAKNTYDIEIPEHTSILELLDGINEYSLQIEGVKDFNLSLKNVFQDTDGKYKVRFTHGITPAPTSPQEYLSFHKDVNNKTYSLLDSSNTWANETEMAIFVNQLNEYKANNPSTGGFGQELIQDVIGTGVSAAAGAIVGGPIGAAVGAGAGLTKSISSSLFGRSNKKKAPESVTGDESTYFNMIYSKQPYEFLLTKKEFVGFNRGSIIKILYRNGLPLDGSPYIVDKFEDIKRDRFNYLKSFNINEALSYEAQYPEAVMNSLSLIFANGIRLWHDLDGYNTYNEQFNDNGDTLEELIK